MSVSPQRYFVNTGTRAVKSVRVSIHGIDPEFTVQPRWMEDGRIVHHIETAEDFKLGTELELDPRGAYMKELKADLFVVMVPVRGTQDKTHLTVGLHATRARAEQQIVRLRLLQ